MRTVAQSETVGPLDQLAQRWARSGAMSLTGRSDGAALGCRSGVVEVLELASTQLVENSQRIGTEVAVDGLALLCERAAITGLSRRGSTSCGGATRLLQTADGYLALSLARPEDIDLLPALLGDSFASLRSEGSAGSAGSAGSIGSAEDQVWSQIEGVVRNNRSQELEALGVELGLAIARLPLSAAATGWVRSDDYVSITDPTHPPDPDDSVSSRVRNAVLHAKLSTDRFAPSSEPDRPIRVVDLSSLWAGPLCGQLLSAAGCDVIKVESVSRPDGARMGSPEFFDLLNGTKRSVSLDFANREDIRALIDLLASADVVIEASRPRALEQLGIDRDAILATSGISVWLQITGHGASGLDANRIGFGDDAAVAASLVSWDGDQPVFCADAIADPATGLLAASAVLEALGAGGQWLLDASLRRTANAMAHGPILNWLGDCAAPRARPIPLQTPPAGNDTHSIISALTAKTA